MRFAYLLTLLATGGGMFDCNDTGQKKEKQQEATDWDALLANRTVRNQKKTMILIGYLAWMNEIMQRRTARFSINDYACREAGCVSEMLKNYTYNRCQPDNQTDTFHKHIQFHGHLCLPVENLIHPVQRLSKHINKEAPNIIHTSKNS